MKNLDLNDPLILQNSIVVSASAGSGKTFTLTVLVTATLGQEAIRPFEILATTFSEAATADLRERLLRPLDLLANLDTSTWGTLKSLLGQRGEEKSTAVEETLKSAVSSGRLAKSIPEVVQASVHWQDAAWAATPARAVGFWRRIRREAELLQVSTLHGLALGLVGQGEGAPESILDVEHPALLRLLRETLRESLALPEGHPDQPAASALLAWAEKNWVPISRGHDSHRDALGHLNPVDLRPRREATLRALDQAEALFRPLAANPERAVDPANRYSHNFNARKIIRVPEAGTGLPGRIKWAQKQSSAIRDSKGKVPQYYTPELVEAFEALGPVADGWEAWLGGLLIGALARFETRKRQHSQGTFGDLVRQALEGLEAKSLEPPRPRLLLVDECQDISRAQDAFLNALEAERTLRVGDLKQAIYGFRGGDPELLQAHLRAADGFAFRLPANFRSAPEIVELANGYVDDLWPRLDPTAGDLDGRQESVKPASVPVGLVSRVAPSRGSNLPDLADWIVALSLEEGWSKALGGEARPGQRRRALLLPKRTKLPKLIRLLKGKGIQPYVVAKEGYWDSPGVRLAMAAFEAVAHPDRALPCAALLRHLLGMNDGEICSLAASPRLPGLGDLEPSLFPEPYREGVRWLMALAQATSQELMGRLLVQGALLEGVNALKAHGAMEPARARRNLVGLLSQVMVLPASPVAAYAILEEERGGKEKGDLPAASAGADLLIQTVHASKGLEYDDVILPLLPSNGHGIRTGELRTDPASGALALVWKLGSHPGAAFRSLKAGVEAKERRDSLNLLYVGLTRAKDRMCLLLQAPAQPKPLAEAKNWAHWGHFLAEAQPQLKPLGDPPVLTARVPVQDSRPQPPNPRDPLEEALEGEDAHGRIAPEVRVRARREGEAMHAYLRDLLVRWEDAEAFAACLDAPPEVPQAREHALRFLEAFEARGWRHLRRRTELPIEGAAATGALGFADLVVWDEGCLHLLDFKNSRDLNEEDLTLYRVQLQRYANVLRVREGLDVEAWLVPLKDGGWVAVPLASAT